MFKRIFWMGTGIAVGASGAFWAKRKVEETVEQYLPEQVAIRAAETAKGLGTTVRQAAAEGREAMRTTSNLFLPSGGSVYLIALAVALGATTSLPVATVALVVLGGDSLGDFALALLLGLVVGTLSSVFTATPLLLELSSLGERTKPTVRETPAPRRERVPAGAGRDRWAAADPYADVPPGR